MLKTVHSFGLISKRTLTQLRSQPQLYLHPQNGDKYTLSFAKDPNRLSVGTVKTPAKESNGPIEEVKITSQNFEKDPKFLPFLFSVISKTIHQDFTFLLDTFEYKGQYMPVFDLRNPPNYQRIPEVEDTFGFVSIDSKGNVIEGSFEPNEMYMLVSSDGPLKLSEHLHEKVLEALGEEP